MKINDVLSAGRLHAPFARSMACLLLIGILYAITFGSAHSHRNATSRLDAKPPSAAQDANSSSNVSLQRHSNIDECLICLFHQQLFNGFTDAAIFLVTPAIQASAVSEPMAFCYSNPSTSPPNARPLGRAPPLN